MTPGYGRCFSERSAAATFQAGFSGFRYIRGEEQVVTRAAPKRPHAPDQAHHPYVESSPSLTMHFLAATFWTNALAGNWRQWHLNPSEGSIRRHPYGTVLGLQASSMQQFFQTPKERRHHRA